ncbi:DUF4190 domain-containing protein [Mesobacillus subterraneus]|uniref:DUF4190 domain-containing protein n=1 Tax=Mesobacillus subterraneus TaxID=285983 RepID=UPI00203E46F2|nr:DUF4190 domain-containing protein [Mesobacillus subterraneus]MCM3683750.1 DUF4190 domain-containing protein [Mesobacillus subterraneus]
MADQERKQIGTEYITEPKQDVITIRDARDEIYQEETAAELYAPARDEHYQEMTAIAGPERDEHYQEMTAIAGSGRDEHYQEMTAIALPGRNEQYQEETAAEFAVPAAPAITRRSEESTTGGRGLAYSALALSILSLFILPVFFGAAGIVLGFMARRRGSAIGSWAIGIGTISILVGIFILPFF